MKHMTIISNAMKSLSFKTVLVLTLALVAAPTTSLAQAWPSAYYLIVTGYSSGGTYSHNAIHTVSEGGNTTFRINFKARNVPHSFLHKHSGDLADCWLIPNPVAFNSSNHPNAKCHVLITDPSRIRPVILISNPTEAAAHGWALTTTSYPTTTTAAWDHEVDRVGVYDYDHTVTVTATATDDACKGPQTSTFTASIVNANASNAVLHEKTYTLRKKDNDLLGANCS